MTLNISYTRVTLLATNSFELLPYQTRTWPAGWYRHSSQHGARVQAMSLHSRSYVGRDKLSRNHNISLVPDGHEGYPSVTDKDGTDSKTSGSFLQRQASAVPQRGTQMPHRAPLRTMTRTERETFGNLLEQLAAMRQEQRQEGEQKGTDLPSARRKLSEEDYAEMSHISSIFDGVLNELRRKVQKPDKSDRSGELAGGGQHGGSDTTTVRMTKVDENSGVSLRTTISMVARRESAKIEHALRDAIDDGRGDTGVWDVCKHQIFSMLQYLREKQDLEEHSSLEPSFTSFTQSPAGQQKDRTLRQSEVLKPDRTSSIDISGLDKAETEVTALNPEVTPIERNKSEHQIGDESGENISLATDGFGSGSEQVSGSLEIPSFVPAEAVVSVLYPRMLLVAFRLINTHFPTSPLISQFRSTIRSHGRVSAVLGASTGLYNELLYFQWRGCNDLPGVISLLREMDVTGVEPNLRTKSLVDSIVAQRESDLKRSNKFIHESEGEDAAADQYWDMAPNRKAMQEITEKDGFVSRLLRDAGKKEFERRERSSHRRRKRFHGRR